MYEIFTQILGFIAMALGIMIFQGKNRAIILIVQLLASVFWTAHFGLLHAYEGMILNAVVIVRNVIFYFKENKFFGSIFWLYFFICVFGVCTYFTWTNPISLLPLFAMIFSTVSSYMTDPKKIRLLALTVSPLWLIYDAVSGSLSGVLTETFVICSIIFALIRYRNKKVQPENLEAKDIENTEKTDKTE